MTTPQTDRPRGPAGMPAHLWDLACSDVRTSVPERIRAAVANGMNAPDGVRRIAARVATVGAAIGIPAALIGIGATAEGFTTSDAPVDLAGGEAPLDALDPAPPVPGSESTGPDGGGSSTFDAGSGGATFDAGPDGATFGVGPDGGFASQTTTGTGDVGAGMGTTWQVQEPGAEPGEWLTVQMFQDVTVTETADGMFVVDAYQYIVIRDDDGNEYVFKEHYQVIVPDPPGQETDLVIHERGFVHVIENPDGSFRIDSTDHGIDVVVTSDGDGRDEVGITQTQGVKVTDKDKSDSVDVTVNLNETANSTSDDTGDEATTTIEQGQVFTDKEMPPEPKWKETTGTGASTETSGPAGPTDEPAGGTDGSVETGGSPATGGTAPERPDPFGDEAAGRQTTTTGSGGPATPGNPGPVAGGSAGGGAAGGAAAGNTAAPLTSTIAVATPVAATTAWQTQPTSTPVKQSNESTPDRPEDGSAAGGDTGTGGSADEAPSPFVGGKSAAEPEPFDPPTPPKDAADPDPVRGGTDPAAASKGGTGTDTGNGPDGGTANAGPPQSDTTVDELPDDTTPVEHTVTERSDDQTGGDTAPTGTDGDGADHALVS